MSERLDQRRCVPYAPLSPPKGWEDAYSGDIPARGQSLTTRRMRRSGRRVQTCLETPSENNNQDCRSAAQAEFAAMGIKAHNGRVVVPVSLSLDPLAAND